MDKIRIISMNKSLLNTISGILSGNYEITSKKITGGFSYFELNNPFIEEDDISDVALLIIDLANLNFPKIFNSSNSDSLTYSSGNKYVSEYDYRFLQELQRIQIPKLLIMTLEQKEILLESLIRYEDV
ncbi:MAG: hypothetical protein ACYCXK_08745, partial [Candidatus Humimicrobiaceae bacterium]